MIIHFHRASLRLSTLYLGVMMAISLFFSLNIYQLSVQEFDRGLRGGVIAQEGPIAGSISSVFIEKLQTERDQQYQAAKKRITTRLILINLAILVGGGFLSYYLARLTLKPIEEAHAGLERFTADASHELRTPIAAMRAETEVALMNNKLSTKEARELLESNLEELSKLTTLSEGLLRLAHTGNGIAKTKLSLDSLITGAVSRVLKAAEKKHILIAPGQGKKLQILGESASLTEALVTVLDNAVKYSPEKTEIKIETESKQRFAQIDIIDQGVGIKASELPYVFERFYRADSSRSKQDVNGYGLGLAIAKNIIEMHGGTISAESTPGKGSVFSIKLPLS